MATNQQMAFIKIIYYFYYFVQKKLKKIKSIIVNVTS